jgi:hypothetical protein
MQLETNGTHCGHHRVALIPNVPSDCFWEHFFWRDFFRQFSKSSHPKLQAAPRALRARRMSGGQNAAARFILPQPAAAFETAQPIFVISSCCSSLVGSSGSGGCLLCPGPGPGCARACGCGDASVGLGVWICGCVCGHVGLWVWTSGCGPVDPVVAQLFAHSLCSCVLASFLEAIKNRQNYWATTAP